MKPLEYFTNNTITADNRVFGRTFLSGFGMITGFDEAFPELVEVTMMVNTNTVSKISCELLNISSKFKTEYVVPSIGDKVVLISMQRYDSSMFKGQEPIVVADSDDALRYGPLQAIAIPLNVFQEESSFFAKYEEERLAIITKEGYTIDVETGTVNITGPRDDEGNSTMSLNIKDDGNLTYTVKDKGSIAVSAGSTFDVSIDADKCTICGSLEVTK